MTFQLESQFLVIASMSEVIAIRRIAKEMAHEMGFSETDREEIGLAVSELASNIVKHAGRGLLTLTPLAEMQRCGLMIEVEDEGQGFLLEDCFRDGVSSSGTLGVGLGAVNRLMDEFTLAENENKQGMRIVCKRWRRDHSTKSLGLDCPLNYGVLSRPKLSEHVNGDSFLSMHVRNGLLVGVIDGVGHGVHANQAATTARHYIEKHGDSALLDIFRGVERACLATRGVVMALVLFDWRQNLFQFASVGNIEIKLFNGGREKPRFILRRGIVGKNAPLPVVTENPWQSGDMLALHSDGISTQWQWGDFIQYSEHPAQVIAEHIFHASLKKNDDATLVIVK